MVKVLTLVIPTYNMEKYLHKCLDSLILKDKEIFDTLEVLVVIDGAKDSSSAIAHEYQDKYSNVFRVIDKENGNYGSCVNRGLKEAKGQYIKILDADDSFNTNELALFLKQLSKIDVDLLLTDYVLVNEENKPFASCGFSNIPKNTVFLFEQLPESVFNSMAMHAVTYKTENLRKINYKQTEGISYTDQEWIFEPFLNVERVYYCKLTLYRYLIGRSGQTMDAKVRYKSIAQEISVLKSLIATYSESESVDRFHRNYLKRRLSIRLNDTYSLCISSKDISIHYLLEETDHYLEVNSKDMYQETNRYTIPGILKYKYINHWRKDLKPMPRFYLFSMAMAKKFKSLKIRLKG